MFTIIGRNHQVADTFSTPGTRRGTYTLNYSRQYIIPPGMGNTMGYLIEVKNSLSQHMKFDLHISSIYVYWLNLWINR